ncbi:MAG: DNA polymerase III subunit alpha, partial [Nitrospirales bacterium]|nr:DNA polymerase III subunit alpha [Nitrospirales bacterium]
ETTGIFQLESGGMRDILVKMQPNRFEDLIALVALYRPGPIGSGMIDDFIRRKKGEMAVEYDLPQLKDILDETYGIILYQEQVMRIANVIASFSLGQADLLRRAMGKKKPEEMEKQKDVFLKGAAANEIPEAKAARLFDLMAYFAEYGFNKSHSAAYAYLSYQTAYLKTHYPVEFMAANLSADMGDTDKIVKLINECRNMTIEILPPDINESSREFTITGKAVRFGLEAVKGVGSSALEIIVEEREKGKFSDFDEFLTRVDSRKVNKKVMESLIKAGAFDSLFRSDKGTPLPPALARAKAMDGLSAPNRDKGPGLFGDFGASSQTVEAWDETTLLTNEKDSLGFYVSGHPLSRYRTALSSLDVVPIIRTEDMEDRAEITVSGIISEMKSKAKEKGITAYLTIEDETGSVGVLAFNDIYKKSADFLKKGCLLTVKGHLSKAEKGSKIIAREIQDITGMELKVKYEVVLRGSSSVEIGERLKDIRRWVEEEMGKDNNLSFRIHMPDYCVIIASRLQPKTNFASQVERIPGAAVKVVHC